MSYKKFTKDIGLFGLMQVITAVSGIITLPIITKMLGAENYGIWTQLWVTFSLISSVALLGLPYTIVRFLSGEKDKEKVKDGIWSVFAIILGISILISLILIFFSTPISRFFNCPKIFIQILAIIIIFDYLNMTFYSVLRAFQQIGKFCFFTIFRELGETGFVVLAIYSGYGLFGALLAFLAIRVIIFLMIGGYIIKEIGFKVPQFLKIKEYLYFGLPTIPATVSDWFVESSDRYLIGFFLGTLFVGYYAPAYAIGAFALNFLVAPFSFLLPAILSKHYDDNQINETKNYLKYSLKYFLMLAIPSVFGLTALSKQLLTIMTTAEFAKAGYLVMPIVALSMLPMGANAIIAQIISITKKMKVGAAIIIASALLNLGLNFIFIPKFGIIGAAITTLIAHTFTLLLTWRYSFKYFKFEIDWVFALKSILASALMCLFVSWLNPLGLYKTLVAILCGVLIYGVLIILFKGFTQQEIQLFKKTIKGS